MTSSLLLAQLLIIFPVYLFKTITLIGAESSEKAKEEAITKGSISVILATIQAHRADKPLLVTACDVLDRLICKDTFDNYSVNGT